MLINNLDDLGYKSRIRKGRGHSSGKGKTAGRGVKGQKSRSGVSIYGFEGGQMPIYKRLPKRGFNKKSLPIYIIDAEKVLVSLKKEILAGKTIDIELLRECGFLKTKKSDKQFKVKILNSRNVDIGSLVSEFKSVSVNKDEIFYSAFLEKCFCS